MISLSIICTRYRTRVQKHENCPLPADLSRRHRHCFRRPTAPLDNPWQPPTIPTLLVVTACVEEMGTSCSSALPVPTRRCSFFGNAPLSGTRLASDHQYVSVNAVLAYLQSMAVVHRRLRTTPTLPKDYGVTARRSNSCPAYAQVPLVCSAWRQSVYLASSITTGRLLSLSSPALNPSRSTPRNS